MKKYLMISSLLIASFANSYVFASGDVCSDEIKKTLTQLREEVVRLGAERDYALAQIYQQLEVQQQKSAGIEARNLEVKTRLNELEKRLRNGGRIPETGWPN